MDFEFSDDQVALVDAMRSLIKGRFQLEQIRALEGQGSVIDRARWEALADAGVFSLSVPESEGGVGLGLIDAAIVFEELGRALVPGPLVATHLATRLCPAFVASLEIAAPIVGSFDRSDEGGAPKVLEHPMSLDGLVCMAGDSFCFVTEPGKLAGTPVRALDPLTPFSVDGLLPVGSTIADPEGTGQWRVEHRILTGALCVGIAAQTCEMAVEYAKGRRQFGRPIGSFQAIKHLCADMLTRAEVARAGVHAAALAVDQPDVGDAVRASAGAAVVAANAALANAKTCIQVHGGMGFTWEVPAHLYLTRAKSLIATLGPLDALATIVAERY